MRIVFMGTMNFAVPVLQSLDSSHDIVLVVTQPDRPAGRKRELKSSPSKEYAVSRGIPLFQPERIRKQYQPVLDANSDLIVVAAFGQMIPNIVLDFPRFRCINVHASLLPKYRGGAPMHRAIIAGEESTGVTVMYMAQKMDAGEILSQASIPILEEDNVGTVEMKLGRLGAELLLETLPKVVDGSIVAVPQKESEVTFAYNLKPEEETLDFSGTMKQVFDHVRGFFPWPIASTSIDGMKMKIHAVSKVEDRGEFTDRECGEIVRITKNDVFIKVSDGLIALKILQLEGKKPMDIKSFLNGSGKTLFTPGKILK